MKSPSPELLTLPRGAALVAWRRSKRARRVSIRIDPRDGAVVVTLPPRGSRAAGISLLMDHADWVAERLAALPSVVRIAEGALLPIAGIPHRIVAAPGARGGAWVADGALHVSGEPAFLARRVLDWLRGEARRRLSAAALAIAGRAGLRPSRVTVKDTKSRWGSCTPDGVLMFSWRLLMAPDFVQDYVVAHEVAHLRHMNHAPAFWALVETLTPHRARAEAWLRSQGPGLLRIG